MIHSLRRLGSRPVGGLASYMSSTPTASNVTVYGHYVSQPSRSVIWLLKIKNQPFNFTKIDVAKGEARTPEYKAKFPTCLVPGLEDNGFFLAEGSAILQYLCEKYGWNDWWPIGNDEATRHKRAKIAEFLSSHHHTTRLVAHEITRPLFFGKEITAEMRQEHVKSANRILKRFEGAFLKEGPYINAMPSPTIADLIAYCEIGQLLHFDILPNFDAYPAVKVWASKMSALPLHDDVHSSNYKFAELLKKKLVV